MYQILYRIYQGAKVYSEVGNNVQSLPKGLQKKKLTIGREIGVPLAQGLNVSNFLKISRVPKSISK